MSVEKKEISMVDMLKAGVHFGHKKSKRHPKMRDYIYAVRNEISIIDLVKTKAKLGEAVKYAEEISKKGGVILFVGTKRQVRQIVKNAAIKCSMPYAVERWIGGTFTNFEKISAGMTRLEKLVKEKESGELDKKYTKKEIQEIDREIKRLELKFGGIRNVKRLPDAVFIVDILEEETAVKEAMTKSVPIIAIVDTNADPDAINYPIPANDDAIRSVEFITNSIAGAIIK